LEPRPNGSIIVGMYAFTRRAGKWLKQHPRRKLAPIDLTQLRVATFNVWFDRFESQRRCDAVLSILEGEAPDVIALEEVTPPFLDALLASPWVRAHYASSCTRLVDADRYDVVMLSRLPVARFTAHPLTSDMRRKLHAVEIRTTRGTLVVAGIHLESMRDRTPTRLQQIDECIPILSRAECAIWLGDFNAAPSSDEDERIGSAFRDAWAELSDAPGYTRDTTRNAMLAKVKDDRHQRIDRIFWRGDAYRPAQIRMLGTAPLDGSAGQIFPSDHFGLIAELQCSAAAGARAVGQSA
jgi:endonuclease/exonuclease/phosphatase family metal-dependent hydrolase